MHINRKRINCHPEINKVILVSANAILEKYYVEVIRDTLMRVVSIDKSGSVCGSDIQLYK